MPEITYFKSPAELRKWFRKNHRSATELMVGFYKRDSGIASVTWPEAVDEALSVGWIDGVRRRIDDARYSIRFTPRKPQSIWSAVNIRRMQSLIDEGRVQPAGLEAFEKRQEKKSRIYAYEQDQAEMPPHCLQRLEQHPEAWAYLQAQPPWYRKKVSWWLLNAKKEETRQTRLDKLIAACEKKQLI